MIYRYELDLYNDGCLFDVKIESLLSRNEVEEYLFSISNCVCYKATYKSKARDDKGQRKIPIGTIVNCSFRADKINTFNRFRSKQADERMTIKEIDDKGNEAEIEVKYGEHWEYTRIGNIQDNDIIRVYYNGKPFFIRGQKEFKVLAEPYLANDIWQVPVGVM